MTKLMKNLLARKSALALAALVITAGCAARKIGPPPVTVEQYNRSLSNTEADYPPRTVVLYNLKRVLDPKLPQPERLASLDLVKRLDQNSPDVRSQLMGILADESNGEQLRLKVLEMLLGRDDPSLSAYAVRILPGLKADSPLRGKILAWLGRNPAPGALGETVQLWAKEKSPTSLQEPHFREAVEQISGKSWDQALVDAINTPGFRASQEAIEILNARLTQGRLRSEISSMTAKTDVVLSLQVLIKLFASFPMTRSEIQTGLLLAKVSPVQLEDASRLAAYWRQNYGYVFNVRDFYLINHLARDPMRKNLSRTQLILSLAQSFIKRPHVARKVLRPTGPFDFSDQLSKQVDNLSMVDLWNLVILNEMLSRPLVQRALTKMANRDLEDTTSVWGGLIFYVNGQAEAKLYPADTSAGGNDLIYQPSEQFKRDSRASLCQFFGHFEKIDNAERAGPTAQELRNAATNNVYGLVLTRISKTSFCAHYFTPKGLVISMGVLPLR